MLIGEAKSHEWYPRECCSKDDCVQVDKVDYYDKHMIFHTKKYGQTKVYKQIFNDPSRARASQDQNIHICVVKHDDYQFVRCVFFPGAS